MSVSGKSLLAAGVMAMVVGQAAAAVEVGGYRYDDTVQVGGQNLVLNGAGIRTKFNVRVYSAALYLQAKQTTPDAVLKAAGPRRVRMVMQRDLGSDDFGMAFMAGLNSNVSDADKAKIVSQISKIGELFAQVGGVRKGDIIDTDWIPGSGTQCYLNGKKIGAVMPDQLFYNALLKIWLGAKPVDPVLKTNMLGQGTAVP